jgi:hypothetical protein
MHRSQTVNGFDACCKGISYCFGCLENLGPSSTSRTSRTDRAYINGITIPRSKQRREYIGFPSFHEWCLVAQQFPKDYEAIFKLLDTLFKVILNEV